MLEPRPLTRRELLQGAAAAAGTAALGAGGLAWAEPPKEPPKLPLRPLGKSGRSVSMLGLGTGALGRGRPADEAVKLVRHAIDAGITFVDTAPNYRSEQHIGEGIAGRRKDLFLATKTGRRGYDEAMRELEQSLSLLKTDYLDLWHVHSLGKRRSSGDEELVVLRREDGAMKAMRKMKEEGVVKLIGFTGHSNPDAMIRILEADDLAFDAMLFVISAAQGRNDQRAWEDRVLPAGKKKGIGLIAMKVFGGGRAVGSGEDKASPARLLSYVWDRGVSVAAAGLYSEKEIDTAVAACKAYEARNRSGKQELPEGGGPAPAADLALRERLRGVPLPFEQPGYVDGWHPTHG